MMTRVDLRAWSGLLLAGTILAYVLLEIDPDGHEPRGRVPLSQDRVGPIEFRTFGGCVRRRG